MRLRRSIKYTSQKLHVLDLCATHSESFLLTQELCVILAYQIRMQSNNINKFSQCALVVISGVKNCFAEDIAQLLFKKEVTNFLACKFPEGFQQKNFHFHTSEKNDFEKSNA